MHSTRYLSSAVDFHAQPSSLSFTHNPGLCPPSTAPSRCPPRTTFRRCPPRTTLVVVLAIQSLSTRCRASIVVLHAQPLTVVLYQSAALQCSSHAALRRLFTRCLAPASLKRCWRAFIDLIRSLHALPRTPSSPLPDLPQSACMPHPTTNIPIPRSQCSLLATPLLMHHKP